MADTSNLANIRNIGIMAHIDAGKLPLLKEFYTIPAEFIGLAKWTKGPPPWIG